MRVINVCMYVHKETAWHSTVGTPYNLKQRVQPKLWSSNDKPHTPKYENVESKIHVYEKLGKIRPKAKLKYEQTISKTWKFNVHFVHLRKMIRGLRSPDYLPCLGPGVIQDPTFRGWWTEVSIKRTVRAFLSELKHKTTAVEGEYALLQNFIIGFMKFQGHFGRGGHSDTTGQLYVRPWRLYISWKGPGLKLKRLSGIQNSFGRPCPFQFAVFMWRFVADYNGLLTVVCSLYC